MYLSENRRLAMIAGAGGVACILCTVFLRPASRDASHDRKPAQPGNWSTLEHLQFENRQLRARIEQAGGSDELDALEAPTAQPKVIAVPETWLRRYVARFDVFSPQIAFDWGQLLHLTDDQRHQLDDIATETWAEIREFEATHASIIIGEDGIARIVIEPFPASNTSPQSSYISRMQERFAEIVGSERARLVANSLQESSYGRDAGFPVELSIESEGDHFIVKHKEEGNLSHTMQLTNEVCVQSVVDRYGHLLEMESAAPLRQSLETVLESLKNQ